MGIIYGTVEPLQIRGLQEQDTLVSCSTDTKNSQNR